MSYILGTIVSCFIVTIAIMIFIRTAIAFSNWLFERSKGG